MPAPTNNWLHQNTEIMTMTKLHPEPAANQVAGDTLEFRIRLTTRAAGTTGLVTQSTSVSSFEAAS